jgi:hypothetical protein
VAVQADECARQGCVHGEHGCARGGMSGWERFYAAGVMAPAQDSAAGMVGGALGGGWGRQEGLRAVTVPCLATAAGEWPQPSARRLGRR